MNQLEQLQTYYGELATLTDLETRLRALTEFDKLEVHVHRSGDVIHLDPVAFTEPLVNTVRADIRNVSTKIKALLQAESLEMQKATANYGPVTIDTPDSTRTGPKVQEPAKQPEDLEDYPDHDKPKYVPAPPPKPDDGTSYFSPLRNP